MKRILVMVFMLCGLMTNVVSANFLDSVENIKKYNPDGKKYEFVRTYISSLDYLRKINDRKGNDLTIELDDPEVYDKLVIVRDNLKQDNANWRVARNLMKKYITPENGLMLKAVDVYTKVCNQKIELNTREHADLQAFLTAYERNQLEKFDMASFFRSRSDIAAKNKQASIQLLEASVIVSQVLVSDQTNYYGEIDKLGITENQRRKLLSRLDEFYGDGYDGDVRHGQTFLQASISALREVLEDYSWYTLDG